MLEICYFFIICNVMLEVSVDIIIHNTVIRTKKIFIVGMYTLWKINKITVTVFFYYRYNLLIIKNI